MPSNRNTLADILLGKASPLKKAQRGVTESPSLNRQGKGISANGLRRKSNASVRKSSESPLKQSRKSSQGGHQELVAGVLVLSSSRCSTEKNSQRQIPIASHARGHQYRQKSPRTNL